MASHDVFISYPSQDKVSADAVCHGLEARGVRCWIAPRDVIPGSDWQTSLLDAISDAKATVLVFTSHTNSSEHIKREITAAFEGGAVVIPFRLENVTPQGALRYHLTGVHWLDAFSGELEPHIEQLASTIKRVLARPAPESGVVLTPEIGPGAQPTPESARPATATPAAAAAVPLAAAAAAPASATTAATILPKPATPPPASAPPFPASAPPATPRKGGVKPWMIGAGLAAAAVLGIIAIGLASSGGGDPAADPAAAAAELRQQGVEIGVQSQPEPTGSDTPVPTLDGPVQPAAPEPAAAEPPPVEDPGFDSGYVEEPAADPAVEEAAKPVE